MKLLARIAPLVLAVAASGAFAQSPAPAPAAAPAAAPTAAPAATPAARPADVDSVDHIVAALYDVISGPAGQPRDWDRMRSLFMPGGRMMPIAHLPDGSFVPRVNSVEDYIAKNTKVMAEHGFFETELAHTTEVFGQLAHVFSTYEARHAKADAAPFARGINSLQLYNDGKRWYVVSIMWRGEDATLKLPARYLQSR